MKKFLVLSFCLLTFSFVFASENANQENAKEEKLVLTIDEAVDMALKNSPSIKSAEIDLEIKKRANNMSWNTFLPSFSASGTMSRTNAYSNTAKSMLEAMGPTFSSAASSMPSDFQSESERWKAVGNVNFQWTFNAAMVDSIRLTHSQYENGIITWEQTLDSTKINIKKLFYGLLIMQENLNIQKENLENARARYEQSIINYSNGLVPELSVLNSQVSYENQKPTVISTEQSFKQQLNTFAFLLGLPYGTQIELSGDIDPEFIETDADELFSKYGSNNRDIVSLKNNLQIMKLGYEAKMLSTYTPSLVFSWGYQPVVMDITQSWTAEGNSMDNGSMSITLAFSNLIDMLPFSANHQKMIDTKRQITQTEIALGQLIQNTEMEVHSLVDSLKKSELNIQAMERNVELATKAYDSTLYAYNNGTRELLDVKDAENSLSQAKLGLMNEKFNYISALLDLEYKLNIKLKGIQKDVQNEE